MALGMRHWLGLVVAGCALFAIEALPPQAPKMAGRATMSPAEQRASELGSEIRWSHALLKRLRWQDSLPVLLEQSAEGGVAVGGPAEVPDSMLLRIRRQLMSEKKRLSTADPGMLVGYYIQPSDQAAEPGVPTTPLTGPSPEVLAGVVRGRPYCIVVRAIDRHALTNRELLAWRSSPYRVPSESTDFFYGCRPFVQFGAPGPHVRAWLQAGAEEFASATDPSHAEPRPSLGWEASPSALWFRWPATRTPSVSFQGCLAGRARACLRQAYLDGGAPGERDEQDPSRMTGFYVTSRSDFLSVGGWPTSPFSSASPYLLADLEHEFGPDAVQRFWRSDQDVQAAFENAFGEDMGDWLVRWTARNLPTYRASPSLAGSTLAGSLLLLMLCGAIAAAWAAGRSVA